MDDVERARRGMTVRREVLGDEHVDRAVAATTPFTEPWPASDMRTSVLMATAKALSLAYTNGLERYGGDRLTRRGRGAGDP